MSITIRESVAKDHTLKMTGVIADGVSIGEVGEVVKKRLQNLLMEDREMGTFIAVHTEALTEATKLSSALGMSANSLIRTTLLSSILAMVTVAEMYRDEYELRRLEKTYNKGG